MEERITIPLFFNSPTHPITTSHLSKVMRFASAKPVLLVSRYI
jgi:hypothetical protein